MGYRSVRDLLELPVVTVSELHMGDVVDAFLDLAEQRLMKLSVDWTQMPDQVSGSDVDLPFGQVTQFEPHQVVVADEIAETAGLDFSAFSENDLVPAGDLLDHDVVTREGEALGTLADIFVDEEDGAIVGYEVVAPSGSSLVMPPSKDLELAGGEVVVPERLRHAANPLHSREEERQAERDEEIEAIGPDRKTEQPELYDPDAEIEEPSRLDNPPSSYERSRMGIYE